jgi:hypothetical protein
MVNVVDEIDEKEFSKILCELEAMAEVDFVDPVVGICDIVIMIDTLDQVEETAKKIEGKSWVKELKILKIVSQLDNH